MTTTTRCHPVHCGRLSIPVAHKGGSDRPNNIVSLCKPFSLHHCVAHKERKQVGREGRVPTSKFKLGVLASLLHREWIYERVDGGGFMREWMTPNNFVEDRIPPQPSFLSRRRGHVWLLRNLQLFNAALLGSRCSRNRAQLKSLLVHRGRKSENRKSHRTARTVYFCTVVHRRCSQSFFALSSLCLYSMLLLHLHGSPSITVQCRTVASPSMPRRRISSSSLVHRYSSAFDEARELRASSSTSPCWNLRSTTVLTPHLAKPLCRTVKSFLSSTVRR
ncbi:hypothetical protein HN51_017658 [Arachis hypogaea]